MPLTSLARTVSRELGADWFRLDVFVLEHARWYVNEISYPSHLALSHGGSCSLPRLLDVYRRRGYRPLNASDVLARAMRRAKVGPALVEAPDFATMRHGTDRDYEDNAWQWRPPSPNETESGSEGVHSSQHGVQ